MYSSVFLNLFLFIIQRTNEITKRIQQATIPILHPVIMPGTIGLIVVSGPMPFMACEFAIAYKLW